mmetsp:Transcript_58819/g.156548  ORF Transcript_58819/g.156548 Transcript_58819/m.156548 type:complete len:139 (-) Transcript_58819:199-615(-)
MVFYESTFLIHGKYAEQASKLLLKECCRIVTNNDGCVLRILDLGWRHTARPVKFKRVGKFFYGHWYSMTWGAEPTTVRELEAFLNHSTGVARFTTDKIKHSKSLYRPRSTFYPVLDPDERIAPPLTHHLPFRRPTKSE